MMENINAEDLHLKRCIYTTEVELNDNESCVIRGIKKRKPKSTKQNRKIQSSNIIEKIWWGENNQYKLGFWTWKLKSSNLWAITLGIFPPNDTTYSVKGTKSSRDTVTMWLESLRKRFPDDTGAFSSFEFVFPTTEFSPVIFPIVSDKISFPESTSNLLNLCGVRYEGSPPLKSLIVDSYGGKEIKISIHFDAPKIGGFEWLLEKANTIYTIAQKFVSRRNE